MMLLKINTALVEETKFEPESAIGIDLGTTNSVVSYYRNNISEVIPIKYKNNVVSNLVPSIVRYFKDGRIAVGVDALEESVEDTNNENSVVLSSVKRFIGKNFIEATDIPTNLQLSQSTELELNNEIGFDVFGKKLTPIDVSAEILKFIKSQAESYLSKNINKAVITVPAYFNENQRNATKLAANLAGFEVMRLINEPTSAALAYGLDEKIEGKFVVYDFGGGTFDVSVLNLQKGVFKVLATGGDTLLGGDDIDEALVKDIISSNSIANVNKIQLRYLTKIAKQAKHNVLSKNFNSKFILNKVEYNYVLTEERFNNLVSPIVQKTVSILHAVMKDAEITDFSSLDGVILVGGSTRVELVKTTLEAIFNIKLLTSLNPDEVVAVGAGHLAAVLSGVKQDSVLLDITPLSLGIEIKGGLSEKIIHRNSSIPIEKSQEFTTYKDGQTAMMIHILQGERELACDLQSLGKFSLKGIPALTAGLPRIKVTFKLDMDGLLTVEAKELLSGVKQIVEIKPHVNLSTADMRKMIEDSMRNGKEDIQKRLLISSINDATSLIQSLQLAIKTDKSLLQNNEGEEIEGLIKLINQEIAKSNRDGIDLHTRKLIAASQSFSENRINRDLLKSLVGKNINKINN